MNGSDDEKGGSYKGSYEWPGGLPTTSSTDVVENQKMAPVHAAIREEIKDTMIYIMVTETPIFDFETVEKIATDLSF